MKILTARCRSPNSSAQYRARSSDRLSRPAEAERSLDAERGGARRAGGATERGGLRDTRPVLKETKLSFG